MSIKNILNEMIEEKLNEAPAKIACLKCDEVSTAAAWKKKGGFCPKCKVSSQGVAESVELEEGPRFKTAYGYAGGSKEPTAREKEAQRKRAEKRRQRLAKLYPNSNAFKDVKKEDLDEAVEVRHDRYIRSHGKKARSGNGHWMFTNKDMGDVDYNNEKEVHTAVGKFADAKKSAQQWGKKHGHRAVYVMEDVELDEAAKPNSFDKLETCPKDGSKLQFGYRGSIPTKRCQKCGWEKSSYSRAKNEAVDKSNIKRMKRDPWMPDAPTPKEFFKNGKLVKDKKFYAWVDSQKTKKNESLDEAVKVNKKQYSWGKMITVEVGSSMSFPLHPEEQKKIADLKDGQKVTFKDETGSLVTASREGDSVHLKKSGVNRKVPVALSHFTEATELDEISKSALSNYVKKAYTSASQKNTAAGKAFDAADRSPYRSRQAHDLEKKGYELLDKARSRKKYADKAVDKLSESGADIHDVLNDIIFDFQKKIMNYSSPPVDAKVMKKLKLVDKILDDLRRKDLFTLRKG